MSVLSIPIKNVDIKDNLAWMNEFATEQLLACSVSKLRQDRHKHRGLPYAKIGRSVRYKLIDVQAYLDRCKITPLQ
ncbi:helix-turn-helix domain-containing protein [Desulfovibrio litoralis]|uniref:Helix-turn-helix domain-containing protein n=1 Tax=Desulfovibrio litoralis DSM 11393 TaxID=1121455 RepID=A0A1M7RS91_9BACT|nr:helix-turn-helix domain-containing protein [Desulfovibrio litoralis]SHN48992.1 hypothetical protein SAMN02745728_00083 [Desulfovibrio litoralis DSM 11393]